MTFFKEFWTKKQIIDLALTLGGLLLINWLLTLFTAIPFKWWLAVAITLGGFLGKYLMTARTNRKQARG